MIFKLVFTGGMNKFFWGPIKFFSFALVCFFFAFHCAIFLIASEKRRLPKILQFYSKILVRLLGINLKTSGAEIANSNFLIVANHMSYLDVILIASKLPTFFVTSVEMKNTPFLGHLCQLAGCLFVERRSRDGLGKEIEEVENALIQGNNVTIFPEATSTNGEQILKFKRPLFQASINSTLPLLPVTINYLGINSQFITPSNRDLLCWYGDMTFANHFWNLLCENGPEVEVIFHRAINVTRSCDVSDLAAKTHHIILNNFIPTNNPRGTYVET